MVKISEEIENYWQRGCSDRIDSKLRTGHTRTHTHAHTHTLKKAANAVKSSENRWKSLLCANLRAPVARPDYPSPCSDRWNYGRDGTGPIASSRALSFSPFFFLRLLFVSPPARLIVESQSRPTQSRCAVTELVLFFHRLDIHPHGLHRKSTSSNEIRFLICSMFRSNSRIDRLVHSFFEIHTLLLLTSCCSEWNCFPSHKLCTYLDAVGRSVASLKAEGKWRKSILGALT